MTTSLHYNTVSPFLLEVLKLIMRSKIFDKFRLVGGTSLSLQRGHRMSLDIDLFTNAEYGSIDFNGITRFLQKHFLYVDSIKLKPEGLGKAFFVGQDKNNCLKLDLFYTDDFIDDVLIVDGIRLASIEEIIAMKLDVVTRVGRKKDFWDLHDLTEDFCLAEMLALHEKRYPYSHDKKELMKTLQDFAMADNDFDPVCLKSKYWEVIKLDMMDFVNDYLSR